MDLMDHAGADLLNRSSDSRFRTLLSRATWVLGAVACIALSLHLIGRAQYSGEDSWYPMARALGLLQADSASRIYQTLFFAGHVKFQYPPSGLLLIDLLRHIGLTTSAQYNIVNAGLLITAGLAFSVVAVQTLGPVRILGTRFPLAPVSYLLALRFYPNHLAFQFGQMQILLGLLVVLACLARLNSKAFLAGCLIAAAATVKPQLGLLGLLALWQRDWRFLSGFAIVMATALALSIALYGLGNHLDYLRVLGFLSQHGEYHHLNQSINGILNRLLYDGPSVDRDPNNPVPNSAFPPYIPAVYWSALLTSLLMSAIPFAVRIADSPLARLLGFCLAIVIFTMASPIAWVHHYNVLLPAYVVALRVALDRFAGKQLRIALILLMASLVLTGLPLMPPFGPTVPALNLLQSHVFLGACILVSVLLWLLFSLQRSPQPDHHVAIRQAA
jgi:alpha-1,2-mannosyltransferase